MNITEKIENYDRLPDGALVDFDMAAGLLRVSRRTIGRMCASGHLTKVSVGRSARLRVSELRRLTNAPA
jgi:excisionase family DNA binding protein